MKTKSIMLFLALLPRLLAADEPAAVQKPLGTIIHPGTTNPPPYVIDITFDGLATDPEHITGQIRLDAKQCFPYRQPFGYGASLLLWENNKWTLQCGLHPGITNETEYIFRIGLATSTISRTYFSYAEPMVMHATTPFLYNLGEYYQHFINNSEQGGPAYPPQGVGSADP